VSRRTRPDPVLAELLASVPPPRTEAERAARARPGRVTPGPRRRVTYALPEELVDAFRSACAERDLTQRGVVEHLLRSWLAAARL